MRRLGGVLWPGSAVARGGSTLSQAKHAAARVALARQCPHGRSLRMDDTEGRRTRATGRRGGGLDAGGGWWPAMAGRRPGVATSRSTSEEAAAARGVCQEGDEELGFQAFSSFYTMGT